MYKIRKFISVLFNINMLAMSSMITLQHTCLTQRLCSILYLEILTGGGEILSMEIRNVNCDLGNVETENHFIYCSP